MKAGALSRPSYGPLVGACAAVFLLVTHARPQEAAPVEYGLPGWKGKERDRILQIVVLKQDLTLNFHQAARYLRTPAEIESVAGAFAGFERVPEPEPEYDKDGRLIAREYGQEAIQPLYQLVLKQPRSSTVLYVTVDRTEAAAPPPASTGPGGGKPPAGEAGGGAETVVQAPGDKPVPPAQPGATVTVWQMHFSTLFRPYCRRTYTPLGKQEVPAAVAVLDALYPSEPEGAAGE